jgi:class 3 adenylate cyclase
VIICPSCSAENPDTARFCHACGAALEAPAAPVREERKVVTVLFADLVGFTARAEQLDPEDVRGLLAPYHAHLRGDLERFGGRVEKFIGDAVVALFGAPTAHEDDPERAVRAALAIRDWVTQEGNELQLRVAVNTGEALIALGARPSEGEGMASGDVINTAARLQSAAPVNGILVGETTYRATKEAIDYREAEPVEAKGKSEPVPAWEALEARSRLGVDLAEARAPLVGREHELDILRDALKRARSRGLLQLVTLVGVPGIGKSRLVSELFRSVEAEPDFTTWRQGRSLPYGERVSFWALAEIVKAQAGILESDSAEEVERKLRAAVEQVAAEPGEADWMASRLGNLVGTTGADDDSVAQGESFSAWRRFLEALADRHPLVLVFEDLHWADDGLLDFVDQLVDWARETPVLVLCTARPELLERRPGWGGGKANATTISLPPLEDNETAKLFSSLLDRAVLPAETQSVLLAHAAGNPLYAEQYARMLGERGEGEELPLPETVQGIIAARLDGLSADEKALLQDASVVGKVFWLGAVGTIGGVDREQAEAALMGLERKELVQRARRSSVEGEAEYAFRHLLVRDVAYGQIPRAARVDKHMATADWVEALGRPEDRAEMLAHHYSSALEYARASGREDAELERRARLALREAAERAAQLAAWPAAARFYEEAHELWPSDDPERPQLRFRLGLARVFTGGEGLELMAAAVDELEAAGETEAAAAAAVALARELWGSGVVDDTYLQRALDLVGDRPDSPARVAALAGQAGRYGFQGQYAESLALNKEALPAAERLGLDDVRVRLLEMRGYGRLTTGDEGGFDDFAEAIRLGTEIHAYDRLHTALNNFMEKQLGLGQLEAALETFEAMKRNLERYVTEGERRWVLMIQGNLDFIVGKWSEASRSIDEFIAELDAGSPHYLESPVRLLRAWIRRATGNLAGASEDADKALEAARRVNDAQIVSQAILARAAILIDEDRRPEALKLAREAIDQGERYVHVLNDTLIVDAAWAMHDLGLGEEYRPLLELSRDRPWAAAGLAICAGDFRRAADALTEIGYRPGEAYARLRAAKQLVEEGKRAEADAQLTPALAFWREVGATRYVREGEALLAESA